MGLKLSWVAIRGLERSKLLERLGVEQIGARSEPGEEKLVLAEQGEWWILVANQIEFPPPLDLAALSVGAELVGCWQYDVVMASDAEGWRDGLRTWAIRYDCERDHGDVRVEGEPPARLQTILAQTREEQAAADQEEGPAVDYIIEVPGKVATSVCGYHTPGTIDLELEPTFNELRLAGEQPEVNEPVWVMPSFLKRLFGKA